MIRSLILSALATLSLSACVIPTGPVEVTRFHRAAEGFSYGSGSYALKAKDSALSLTPYMAAVAREMQRVGYNEKFDGSDVIAEIAVDVVATGSDRGSPVSVGVGGGTGSYGTGVGLGVGINLTPDQGKAIQTTLRVRLLRRSDNLVIWEGRASQSAGAMSPAAQPGIAASKLAAALFQDFPGESGKSITVP